MSAFTPGPWHIEVFASAPDKPFICASWGQEDPVVNEISDVGDIWATARLIAAAPELLAALESLAPLLGGWREVIAEIDDLAKNEALGKAMWACLDQIDAAKSAIRAAIAKARGEQVPS